METRNRRLALTALHDDTATQSKVVPTKEQLDRLKSQFTEDEAYQLADSALVQKTPKGEFFVEHEGKRIKLNDEQMKKFGADLKEAGDEFELEESEEVKTLVDGATYVIRAGEKIKLSAEQIANKKKPRGGLSPAEYKARKDSLKSARKKAHTSGAAKKRQFSMKRRQRVVDAVDLNTLRAAITDAIIVVMTKDLNLSDTQQEEIRKSMEDSILASYDEASNIVLIATPRFLVDDVNEINTDENLPLLEQFQLNDDLDFDQLAGLVVAQFESLEDLIFDEAEFQMIDSLSDESLSDEDKLYTQDYLIQNPPKYISKDKEEDFNLWKAAVHKATGNGKKEVKAIIPLSLYKKSKMAKEGK